VSKPRLNDFIEQTKTIFFFFLLGNHEAQARFVNGLFNLLTEKERADTWAEFEEARAQRDAERAKTEFV
jgi:hypothetical protein